MNIPKLGIIALYATVATFANWCDGRLGHAFQSSAEVIPPSASDPENGREPIGNFDAARQNVSLGSDSKENRSRSDILPSASISEQFHSATVAFQSQSYGEASRLFATIADSVPASELQIQCRYFACIAAWNDAPNDVNLAQIEKWLIESRDFQRSNSQQGRTVRSQAWSQWIETAHLIVIKTLVSQMDLATAERRLRYLTRSASASPPLDDPSFEKMAWPSSPECTPQTWYELGNLLAKQPDGQKEAVACFEKAIELSGTDSKSPIGKSAKIALIRRYVELEQFAQAIRSLNELKVQSLTLDQQIQMAILETKAQSAKSSESHSKDALLGAAESATSTVASATVVSASTYHELVAALSENKFHSEASSVSQKLIEFHPEHPLSQEHRALLSRRYAQQGDWSESLHWASELLNFASSPSLVNYALYMKGKSLRHLERAEEAESTLNQILAADSLAKNLEVATRLELSEMHYQSERWHELPPHLNWLKEHGKLLQVPPEWYPTILLRQAEMFASKSVWKEAESLVSEICEKFPEWEKAPEAEYLLARCFVAKAEFDPARKLLERILSRSPDQVSSTLAARAGWMTGETYMMQRRYTNAVESYQRVLTIPQEPYWHAASAFQIGQCAELCHDLEAAEEWYRKVQTDYAEYPFAKNADERLVHLSSSSIKQAERIGSGKKR